MLAQEIETTRKVCLDALQELQLSQAAQLLRSHGLTGRRALSLINQMVQQRTPASELLAIRKIAAEQGLSPEARLVERAFLLEQGLDALQRLPSLPAVASVRSLWCKEIELFAQPKIETLDSLGMEGRFFLDLCKVIAGKRFPSGQYHWEIGGFPRRWVAKVPLAQIPRLASFLLFSARGFSPFFEIHFRFRPPGIPRLKRAYIASFYRMADSLSFQPHIRGLMAGTSWLHSDETIRVSPHLGFFREVFLEAGGILIDAGPAGEHTGFLVGSPQRVELYRKNEYRPTAAVVLCSREQALAWVNQHPEARQLADNIRV